MGSGHLWTDGTRPPIFSPSSQISYLDTEYFKVSIGGSDYLVVWSL